MFYMNKNKYSDELKEKEVSMATASNCQHFKTTDVVASWSNLLACGCWCDHISYIATSVVIRYLGNSSCHVIMSRYKVSFSCIANYYLLFVSVRLRLEPVCLDWSVVTASDSQVTGHSGQPAASAANQCNRSHRT